jgi:hypothetical protein
MAMVSRAYGMYLYRIDLNASLLQCLHYCCICEINPWKSRDEVQSGRFALDLNALAERVLQAVDKGIVALMIEPFNFYYIKLEV